MLQRKKILSLVLKIFVGLGSFVIIYLKLKNDLTAEKLSLLSSAASSYTGTLSFLLCLLLIPINWGIESYKWKLITTPIEKISLKIAVKSVYSGVCVGNLAPGRATEFLGKIIFFKPENRARITVIHFLNGMFQLSITIITGLIALMIELKGFGHNYKGLAYTAGGISLVLLMVFGFCLYKIDFILELVSKKISKDKQIEQFTYQLTHGLILKISGLSLLRYSVFFGQMLLLLYLFHQSGFPVSVLSSISLYFLITTVIPMISVLEAPIRAAIALVVFKDSDISGAGLALSSVLLWLVNIIIPSIYGYAILLKQNFNFKLFQSKK